jgi:ABC-type polysaccharide/polyol phosphate export permease
MKNINVLFFIEWPVSSVKTIAIIVYLCYCYSFVFGLLVSLSILSLFFRTVK